ncbi:MULTISPECIES: group I truncated hemoglobin [unclassified Brenneria]|uniref:group I truncated hemoglobin n=1 Tax=unclassified Brenneria TaxID=2634434 RepID=UPI001557DC11|nr:MULTISPECIES: group 1 truncated hemoglobin [unclassified Brenneria]MBJ7222325.1 group 1 truncated hemoglobin [Brenneria sp. L3-3C-1]MEE3643568.1 group 1 truncated hemoglobin [Brenneria sp. L3_3C_1]MEE3651277.1 group 1 truncated hemoglobin [Brenneria sp. HEZEL_4_2_4]NPD01233.1 group 1 truncated hemoglobin [Brenneria sp. hezel4-2-4]
MNEQQPAMEQNASLYVRLGGYDAIYVFAGAVLRKTMTHPTIGHIWSHMSESTFMKEHINFVDFLCEKWGGNTKYRGRDMVTAHRGMGLTEEHWIAVFECIDECYDDFNVPDDIREEVTAFLTQFKPVIIGGPSYRDIVIAHPEMDVAKGMKSVGIQWPAPDKSS